MKKNILMSLLLATQLFSTVYAEEQTADEKAIATIKEELKAFPIDSVLPSPIPGVYEVLMQGQIIYFTGDMNYAIQGSIIDHRSRIDLTQKKLDKINAEAFSKLSDTDFVAFKPEGDSKFVLNIFTDVSCGFCRKLHQEVPALNKKGVEVRYFLYPRAGLNSPSAKVLESIWCADNQQNAMNRAKSQQRVEPKSCDNPLETHIALANKMGLTGTPLMFTGGGTRIPGYRDADALYQTLLAEAVETIKKNAN